MNVVLFFTFMVCSVTFSLWPQHIPNTVLSTFLLQRNMLLQNPRADLQLPTNLWELFL